MATSRAGSAFVTDLHMKSKDGAGLTTELQWEVFALTSVLKDLAGQCSKGHTIITNADFQNFPSLGCQLN